MIKIQKAINSFKYAFKGIYWMVDQQNNARIHLLASIFALFLGFYFKINQHDWRWILLSIALVWTIELLNTAIENAVDLFTQKENKLAGIAKDTAAGAVLVVSVFALYIAYVVFSPFIMAIIV